MAQKLTEQEQAAVVELAKLLGKKLPTAHRSNAGGIASGLVRLRKRPLTAADVNAVLDKYGAGADELEALLTLDVLEPTDGGYLLVIPAREDASEEKDAASDQRAIAKAERPRPPARRDARTLSRLDTVRKQTPELEDVRRKIIDLDPRLWINGWLLSTPDAYLLYERELRALSRELTGKKTLGDGRLSLRELSYRVFGDEKFLALESEGRKLLHLMGLSDVVSSRPQVKLELLHHIPRHHRHLRLVVSENLDPWVNMRNAMYLDGRKRLFGERVHGVVFGNGYLVDDPHKLPDLIASLGAEDVRVLYWGDIDRAGLSILAKLADMAEGRFNVEPFVAAYRLMLRRAMERFPDPLENEPTDQSSVPVRGLELLEGSLKKREASYLRSVIEHARLIPQEILTAEDL
ncbi:Wadjet anti-phage system protein JetD domain-containing protein [Olsenella sp. An293]|uniref:Wadjet anti-phage system protein JetD domain-containing protein n=1 Tax=Olsenella sp. An293 TaxID=1965626 RepID=UPI001EF5954C|nr:Wadjet anti-phage system protein JetD domain-containing protein [Olsenella sp. An293]